jgi:hypothetical protein
MVPAPVMVGVSTPGWVIVTVAVAVHPLLSVTVTLYVPAAWFIIPPLVLPLLHEYVKGPVFTLVVTMAEPLVFPLHLTLVAVAVAVSPLKVELNVMLLLTTIPETADVAVTLYVPAALTPEMLDVVAPVDQL